MATYLGSWKIVYTPQGQDGVISDLGSVEQAFYVGNQEGGAITSQMKDIAEGIRESLRTDATYRSKLGIDVSYSNYLNVVFQPPLTKITA